MPRLPIHLLLAAALALAACNGEIAPSGGEGGGPSPTQDREGVSPAGSPIGEGVEAPTATVACANGWMEPTDREERELPFHVIRRTQGIDGEFRVLELRYFEGPESPPSTKGYLQVVDRWYVKAELQGDPSFRGRWLIEERAFGSAVVAAAPFDSEGFETPNWIGFQLEEGVDERLRRFPDLDLPGRWSGRPYDFITGVDLESGDRIFRFSGLPPEVAGCLTDT
jgi:hypothetical protein